jgi:hypothetical protein
MIIGRVTGAGDVPIAGVMVYAYDSLKTNPISSAITDWAGNYILGRFPTGGVKVRFDADRNFLPFATEYYNDQGAFETADPVATTGGETTANINAVLAPIPALTITTASLPDGQIAVPYGASLQASGGRPFYHFSLESGSLPNGLTLSGKGEIAGTPTAAGSYDFAVRVTDSTRPQQSSSRAFTITVGGAFISAGYPVSGKFTASGSPVPGVVIDGLVMGRDEDWFRVCGPTAGTSQRP